VDLIKYLPKLVQVRISKNGLKSGLDYYNLIIPLERAHRAKRCGAQCRGGRQFTTLVRGGGGKVAVHNSSMLNCTKGGFSGLSRGLRSPNALVMIAICNLIT